MFSIPDQFLGRARTPAHTEEPLLHGAERDVVGGADLVHMHINVAAHAAGPIVAEIAMESL